ncbi:hypothetical protein MASR2M78_28780 [Treponema sp.]
MMQEHQAYFYYLLFKNKSIIANKRSIILSSKQKIINRKLFVLQLPILLGVPSNDRDIDMVEAKLRAAQRKLLKPFKLLEQAQLDATDGIVTKKLIAFSLRLELLELLTVKDLQAGI